MRHRYRAGVTLLELLIAVSLFSLLSAGVLMALRVGVNGMAKANTRLMDNRRMAGVQRILEDEIAGFMPVVAECMAGPDQPRTTLRFFQGEPQSMRFVSAYSLGEAWRGYPRILEFQVIPGQDNRGVRLIVNEHRYTGSRGAGLFCLGQTYDSAVGLQVPQFPPIRTGPRSFVLADNLAFCRFSYQETAPPPVLTRWLPRWIAPVWPNAIRIEMAPLELDAARIQPLSLTVPVHVDEDPRVLYGD